MKILEFIYNEKSISFDSVSDEIVMVNATEMAKVFGKEIKYFNELESTKKFIDACLKRAQISREKRLIDGVKSDNSHFLNVEKKEDLILSKQNSGTWMHRILALKFAAWLDPDFEIWVWLTIDKILLGHYREVKAAVYEKMQAENARDKMKKRLLKDNPEFVQFLQLEGKITESEAKRQKAIKASMAQFKLEFQNS